MSEAFGVPTPSQKKRIALLGCPNSGKSTLFNALTGGSQKTANYAGVTFSLSVGEAHIRGLGTIEVVDTPGVYRIEGNSEGQKGVRAIVRDALESQLDALVCVTDVQELAAHLQLVLEAKKFGLPILIALNKADTLGEGGESQSRVDTAALEDALGVRATLCSARNGQTGGLQPLKALLASALSPDAKQAASQSPELIFKSTPSHYQLEELAARVIGSPAPQPQQLNFLDRLFLHPLMGPLLIFVALAGVFQLAFSVSAVLQDWMATSLDTIIGQIGDFAGDGLLARFIWQAALPGISAIVTFLPPILLVSFALIVLENTGVLARMAFLSDRLFRSIGLSGYGLFPLLNGLSCALPAIAAARSIPNKAARLTCIAAIPLMPCAARAPVYALVVTAFIPQEWVFGLSLHGLVFVAFYGAGVLSALLFAATVSLFMRSEQAGTTPIELPRWQFPAWKATLATTLNRGVIYLKRASVIIFMASAVLWILSNIPWDGPGTEPGTLEASAVGALGYLLHPIVAPLGFEWELAVALVPGLWAREVVVGILATIYAVSDSGSGALASLLSARWTLAQGMALGVWYIFAPQCLATVAMMRSETQSHSFAWGITGILFVLAWVFAFITYRLLTLLGFG